MADISYDPTPEMVIDIAIMEKLKDGPVSYSTLEASLASAIGGCEKTFGYSPFAKQRIGYLVGEGIVGLGKDETCELKRPNYSPIWSQDMPS